MFSEGYELTLEEWFDLEQDFLEKRYHKQMDGNSEAGQKALAALKEYRKEVAELINKAIKAHGRKNTDALFGELCPRLEQLNRENRHELSPVVIRYFNMLRCLVRKQIESGEIMMGKVSLESEPDWLDEDE